MLVIDCTTCKHLTHRGPQSQYFKCSANAQGAGHNVEFTSQYLKICELYEDVGFMTLADLMTRDWRSFSECIPDIR